MTRNIRLILCFFLFLCASIQFEVSAKSRIFNIRYEVDSVRINPSYMSNSRTLNELEEFLNFMRTNRALAIDSMKFTGTASPEGYIERNQWLSRNRMIKFHDYVNKFYPLADSKVFGTDSYIPWQRFRNAVEKSDIPCRERVLNVLSMPADTVAWNRGMHTDQRMMILRYMDDGEVWKVLRPILAESRYAEAEFVWSAFPFGVPLYPIMVNPEEMPGYAPMPLPLSTSWTHRFYVKTNLLDWGLLIANLAVEFDIARHWSFALPVFYSCWNYFSPKVKFRVAGFQPELRYWFNSTQNDGWFIGGHFGYTYYNMAFGGEHRYQDADGKKPAMGAGVAFGWRKPFGPGKKWRVEFSAGVGVYPLKYDVFENTRDYRYGKLIETRRKTFIGLDQAAITIGYAIDLHTNKH